MAKARIKGSGGTLSSSGIQNTVNRWKCRKSGPCAPDGRCIVLVGGGETGEDDWIWNVQQRDEQQPEPETGSTIRGLWLCSLGGQANSPNSHLRTVIPGVDSGTEVTVISPDTASDYPREGGAKQYLRDCTGRSVEDLGNNLSLLKWLLGNTYAKTAVALVQKNLLSVAALVDTGHKVVFKKINRLCGMQGQDGDNTSAESVERTRWTSHWSCLRRHQESRNDRYQSARQCCPAGTRSKWSCLRDAAAREQELRGEAIP